MMSRKMSKDRATPLAWSNQPARRGLMKTPRKFDSDAAHNAAAPLPPAIDVNAIDDCTVDGIKQRSTTPNLRGERKSGVAGKSGPVWVDIGRRRTIKQKKNTMKATR